MNNTVYDVDYTRALPPTLKSDEKTLALAKVIAGELQENIRLARLNIIYARIDELDEDLLDILAYDLHVDWYDDSYPIAAKRAVIKDSVRVHKRLGTKRAVDIALGSIFPNTDIEQWYEYGGDPFYFRVIIDMTGAKAPADFVQIVKAIDFYKRLTAHLETIAYQSSARITIGVETQAFRHAQGLAGRYRAGTHPRTTTKGGVAGPGVDIAATGENFAFHTDPAGTKPRRSTAVALHDYTINAEPTTDSFAYRFGMTGRYRAGEMPERNTKGGVMESGGLTPEIFGEAFSFHVKRCGTSRAIE